MKTDSSALTQRSTHLDLLVRGVERAVEDARRKAGCAVLLEEQTFHSNAPPQVQSCGDVSGFQDLDVLPSGIARSSKFVLKRGIDAGENA